MEIFPRSKTTRFFIVLGIRQSSCSGVVYTWPWFQFIFVLLEIRLFAEFKIRLGGCVYFVYVSILIFIVGLWTGFFLHFYCIFHINKIIYLLLQEIQIQFGDFLSGLTTGPSVFPCLQKYRIRYNPKMCGILRRFWLWKFFEKKNVNGYYIIWRFAVVAYA